MCCTHGERTDDRGTQEGQHSFTRPRHGTPHPGPMYTLPHAGKMALSEAQPRSSRSVSALQKCFSNIRKLLLSPFAVPASEFAGGKHAHTPGMALSKQEDPIIMSLPPLLSEGFCGNEICVSRVGLLPLCTGGRFGETWSQTQPILPDSLTEVSSHTYVCLCMFVCIRAPAHVHVCAMCACVYIHVPRPEVRLRCLSLAAICFIFETGYPNNLGWLASEPQGSI